MKRTVAHIEFLKWTDADRLLRDAEIAQLFRFGFEVLALWMGQDKIEDSDTPLNVFELVFPSVARFSLQIWRYSLREKT